MFPVCEMYTINFWYIPKIHILMNFIHISFFVKKYDCFHRHVSHGNAKTFMLMQNQEVFGSGYSYLFETSFCVLYLYSHLI
jgi:hypothetical protein